MTINRKKQRGATLISWLIVAGLSVTAISAVVKVAPYYVEFNSVKRFMNVIAAEPGIKTANMRQINSKIEKHLNLNNLYTLEKLFYENRKNKSKNSKNPFSIVRMKKGNNRKKLTVKYEVPASWIGNLSFLMDFKHSVVLGEPKK